MSVNKKFIAVIIGGLLAIPAVSNANDKVSLSDSTISSLLGTDSTRTTATVAQEAGAQTKSNSENLLFDPTESVKRAKESMNLQEEDNKLDLQISIAKKKQELKSLEEKKPLEEANQKIADLQSKVIELQAQLEETYSQMSRKDAEIASYKAKITELSIVKVKQEDNTFDLIKVTRTQASGNNKVATILYDMSLIQRSEGEYLDHDIFIKKINYDNVIFSDGKKDKTIFIVQQHIAESVMN